MKAIDFMTTKVITCNENQTVSEAAKIMSEKGFSVLPVINDSNKLVGIITESDFVTKDAKIPRALASIKQLFGQNFYFNDIEDIYTKVKNKTLSEVMTTHPVTLPSDTTLNNVVNTMVSKNLKRIPIVDNGTIVGMITRKDLLKAFLNESAK